MKAKLHTEKGFSLAEVLVAILILLMVSTIVATGIPVARNAYEKVVLASNAEVLLSTTMSTLRNELGTAQDVSTDGVSITYYNSSRRTTSEITREAILEDGATDYSKQTIVLCRYSGAFVQNSTPERIATSSSATGKADIYVTYREVAYNDQTGIITFSGLSVNSTSGTVGLATLDTLSIRVISA